MTDLNELFPPDPEDIPDQEPTPEELHGVIAELEIEEMADGIETEIRDIASKFVFEFLLTLINPTPESRKRIINGILTMSGGRIERDVNERIKDDELEPEETTALNESVNKAFKLAAERFKDDYDENFFDEEFLERCRKAVRKNLSR